MVDAWSDTNFDWLTIRRSIPIQGSLCGVLDEMCTENFVGETTATRIRIHYLFNSHILCRKIFPILFLHLSLNENLAQRLIYKTVSRPSNAIPTLGISFSRHPPYAVEVSLSIAPDQILLLSASTLISIMPCNQER